MSSPCKNSSTNRLDRDKVARNSGSLTNNKTQSRALEDVQVIQDKLFEEEGEEDSLLLNYFGNKWNIFKILFYFEVIVAFIIFGE